MANKIETNEERLKRERDLLGAALGKILVATGIITPEDSTNGTNLLMQAEALINDLDSDGVRLLFGGL